MYGQAGNKGLGEKSEVSGHGNGVISLLFTWADPQPETTAGSYRPYHALKSAKGGFTEGRIITSWYQVSMHAGWEGELACSGCTA